MSDKLPSLFDFDDEAFFTKPEKEAASSEEKKVEKVVRDVPEEKSVSELAEDKEDDFPNMIANKSLELAQEKTGEEEGNDFEGSSIKEQRGEEVVEEKQQSKNKIYIKPQLELPQSFSGKAIASGSDEDKGEFVYDKQINGFPEAPKSTLIFESGKEAVVTTREKPSATTERGEEEKEDAFNPEEDPEVLTATAELPEWQLDKNYYTIGEVAQLFGVNVSHIRFWTTNFKIKTRTTRKGDRLYTPEQIAELRLIHHLVKVKKHTLKGAKEALQQGSVKLEKKLDLREELQKLHQVLLEIKQGIA